MMWCWYSLYHDLNQVGIFNDLLDKAREHNHIPRCQIGNVPQAQSGGRTLVHPLRFGYNTDVFLNRIVKPLKSLLVICFSYDTMNHFLILNQARGHYNGKVLCHLSYLHRWYLGHRRVRSHDSHKVGQAMVCLMRVFWRKMIMPARHCAHHHCASASHPK